MDESTHDKRLENINFMLIECGAKLSDFSQMLKESVKAIREISKEIKEIRKWNG